MMSHTKSSVSQTPTSAKDRFTPFFSVDIILIASILIACSCVLIVLIHVWYPVSVGTYRDGFQQIESPGKPDMRLNVNNATIAELQVLPGIGPALAQRIVNDRNQTGRFNSLDDLQRVSGIGPRKVAAMRRYVVVELRSTSSSSNQ